VKGLAVVSNYIIMAIVIAVVVCVLAIGYGWVYCLNKSVDPDANH
jgi:hypothetical protein